MIKTTQTWKIGNCLDLLPEIADKSIDMILTDLPYGVTSRNKWDIVIPFEPLWKQYERIIKDNGVMVFTAVQPFTSELVCSNKKLFKYEWIWDKKLSTGFLNAKKQPLRRHESILVFYKETSIYNPIMSKGKLQLKCTKAKQTLNYNETNNRPDEYLSDEYYPNTILNIPQNRIKNGHPTQKPLSLRISYQNLY